jgi:hypothetical protein
MEKSKGHITVLNNLEYFIGPDGSLYRASIHNFVGLDGYRAGARWQCPGHMVNDYLTMLGIKERV